RKRTPGRDNEDRGARSTPSQVLQQPADALQNGTPSRDRLKLLLGRDQNKDKSAVPRSGCVVDRDTPWKGERKSVLRRDQQCPNLLRQQPRSFQALAAWNERRECVARRWGGIRGLSVGDAPGGAGPGCEKPAIVGLLCEKIVATVP